MVKTGVLLDAIELIVVNQFGMRILGRVRSNRLLLGLTATPMRIRFVVVSVLLAVCSMDAAGPDPRLLTVRKVFIVSTDDLSDDQGVATCLAERLTAPFEVVKTKEEADAVLMVKAHIPGKAARVLLGSMGGTPSATLEAQLPDGTKLWSDGAKFRRGNGAVGLARDVQCGLAGGLADRLRDVVRKARDTKK